MNFRLNSFFWTFAVVMIIEHALALFTGVNDELGMLIGSLTITITVWLLIVPSEWLMRDDKKRLKDMLHHITTTKTVKHQHHWRHWYDTNGYYADEPGVNVPSRVYYCIKCREVHRAVDRIPLY